MTKILNKLNIINMKKKIIILFILLNLSSSFFAQKKNEIGIDINLNDIGISLTQVINNLKIKASLGYPIFDILNNYESADEVVAQDFFETICLHGTINYNLFIYDSFFISIGVASDIFMQFDFDQVHSHYTAFTIGPYGAIGYKFKNEKKEKLNISISLNLPIIAMENKDTNIIEEPQEEAWNELIDYNSSLFNMVSMAYKLNVSIPF